MDFAGFLVNGTKASALPDSLDRTCRGCCWLLAGNTEASANPGPERTCSALRDSGRTCCEFVVGFCVNETEKVAAIILDILDLTCCAFHWLLYQ